MIMRPQQEGHGGTSLNVLPFPPTNTQDVSEAFYSTIIPQKKSHYDENGD